MVSVAGFVVVATLAVHEAVGVDLAIDVWPEHGRDSRVGQEVGVHGQELGDTLWERVMRLRAQRKRRNEISALR